MPTCLGVRSVLFNTLNLAQAQVIPAKHLFCKYKLTLIGFLQGGGRVRKVTYLQGYKASVPPQHVWVLILLDPFLFSAVAGAASVEGTFFKPEHLELPQHLVPGNDLNKHCLLLP